MDMEKIEIEMRIDRMNAALQRMMESGKRNAVAKIQLWRASFPELWEVPQEQFEIITKKALWRNYIFEEGRLMQPPYEDEDNED